MAAAHGQAEQGASSSRSNDDGGVFLRFALPLARPTRVDWNLTRGGLHGRELETQQRTAADSLRVNTRYQSGKLPYLEERCIGVSRRSRFLG